MSTPNLAAIEARIEAASRALPHDPGCFIRPSDGDCPCRHLREATATAALDAADVPALLALVREQAARLDKVKSIVSEYIADYNSGIEIHAVDLETLLAALKATQ